MITTVTPASVFESMTSTWIGVRDIWMDYIKPTALRLALEVITFVVLVAYAAWLAQILWATRQT